MWQKAQPPAASAAVRNRGRLATTLGRALPYLLSWGVLAALMIVGMSRMPLILYTPVDGEWAKWNVEATLEFGKVLDLSPYSMLAGMGSTYFPNLPWLNPGALALGLPLGDEARSVVSYAVYGAELAVSIILLARILGFFVVDGHGGRAASPLRIVSALRHRFPDLQLVFAR